jgi:zinc and cadmium transporter
MYILIWILVSTLLISLLAFVGLFLLYMSEGFLKMILSPLIAFAAGTLLAGAFFHLIPEAYLELGVSNLVPLWVIAGFSIFLLMELILNWHHCHHIHKDLKSPVSYMILLADGFHNFLGGLAIASSFLISVEVGIITWLAAAAHEIPQEFGDFGILIKGGWKKHKALFFNYLSALTVVFGGLIAYFLSNRIDTTFLLPFAAGNFIYIASADLIPEISHMHEVRRSIKTSLTIFTTFLLGVALIILIRFLVKT